METFITVSNRIEIDVNVIGEEQQREPGIKCVNGNNEKSENLGIFFF